MALAIILKRRYLSARIPRNIICEFVCAETDGNWNY